MKLIDKVDITPGSTSSTVWNLITAPASLSGYEGVIVLFHGTTGQNKSRVRPTGVDATADWALNNNNTRFYIEYVPLDGSDQFELLYTHSAYKAFIIGGVTSTEATLFSTSLSTRDITPPLQDGSTETVDLTSHLGGDTAQAAIIRLTADAVLTKRFGYGRTGADTPSMNLLNTADVIYVTVPVVANAIRLAFDLNTTGAIDVHLIGYIKSGLSIITTPSNEAHPANSPNYSTATFIADRPASEDIVFAESGTSFASGGGFREVGDTDIIEDSSFIQTPVRLNAGGEIDYYASFGGSQLRTVAYATNDAGAPTYTITSIDGDNDVQAGQPNVDIVMTATTGITVTTLGGESLTINGVT